MQTFDVKDSLEPEIIDKLIVQVKDKPVHIRVQFPSGTIKETSIKNLIINIFFFRIYLKWNLEIKDFIIKRHIDLTINKIERILLDIYYKILEKNDDYYNVYDSYSDDVWKLTNDIMNFVLVNCGEYSASISLEDLVDLVTDKKFRQELGLDEWKPNLLPIKEVEKQENKIKKKLMKYLRTHPVFGPFIKSKMFNETQLFNVLVSVGFKADTDDKVIPYYIEKSYVEGLDSNIDYVAESLSGKKSAFYNRLGITVARYNERIVELLASSVRNIYPGDCGSTTTIPYYIDPKHKNQLIGKIIKTDDGELMLMEDNIDQFAGQVVNMRSPLTCKYTDGFCEKCGGLMTYFVPRMFNIGMLAGITVVEKVSQRVLSAKHFTQISIFEWEKRVDPSLFNYFKVKDNFLYLRSNKIKFMVNADVVKNIINFPYYDFKYINETNLVPIKTLLIHSYNDNSSDVYNLTTIKQLKPTLTVELVKHFIKNPDAIEIKDENFVLINPKKFDIKQPIIKVDIANKSVIEFVEQFNRFFEEGITHYTSIPDALKDISDLLFTRIKVNIMYIETLLKATLVTSDSNYAIPQITDINNAKFENIISINTKRHLGVWLTYERHLNTLSKPEFLLQKRLPSDYDELFLNLFDESLHKGEY